MRTIVSNGIKIYELSNGSAIPEYLGKRRQQKLKAKHQMISSQLQIIQDLTMPDVTTCISLSPDGKFMFLLGAYSPRIRCYELEELSMKFERNADELPTKIAHIEKDYSKFVILEGERTLSFHAGGGIHHKVPCKNVIKDIIYSPFKNQLFLPDNKGIISVLDVGRGYLSSKIIDSTNSISINSAAYNEITDIFFTGHVNGFMHGYDCRTAKIISSIDVRKAPISEYMKKSYVPEVCKLAFKDPLKIGVGTDKGMFHLYDIRNSNQPFSSRDLDYEFPIKSIIFHDELVIAAVKCVFKIWQPIEFEEGKIIATYDTLTEINDLCQYPNSGLLFAAANVPQIGTYFIPQIADAPPWCQQLSNLIVDVETESQSMYDTHTFITREEVDELKMVNKIGTSALRAYMHGYYVSKETYQRARNAMLAANKNRQEANKSQQQLLSRQQCPHDPLDEVPDPRINVQLKSLINDKRFADIFTCDAFILDPTCQGYEQAIQNVKHLAKKRSKKILLINQAKKSKLIVDNVKDDVIVAVDGVAVDKDDVSDGNDIINESGNSIINDDVIDDIMSTNDNINDDAEFFGDDVINESGSIISNDDVTDDCTSGDDVINESGSIISNDDVIDDSPSVDDDVMEDITVINVSDDNALIDNDDVIDDINSSDSVVGNDDANIIGTGNVDVVSNDNIIDNDDVINNMDDIISVNDDATDDNSDIVSIDGNGIISDKDDVTSISLNETIAGGNCVDNDDVTVISDDDEMSENNGDVTVVEDEDGDIMIRGNDVVTSVDERYKEQIIVISDEDEFADRSD